MINSISWLDVESGRRHLARVMKFWMVAGVLVATPTILAARDFMQPTFAFGPPRLVRLGTEIVF